MTLATLQIFCHAPKFVHARLAAGARIPEGFERNVETYGIAMFDAVHHRLGSAVDAQCDPPLSRIAMPPA